MEDTNDLPYISDFETFSQTITVSDSVSAGISDLSCLYGCSYKPTSSADSSAHNRQKHKKSRDKINSALESGAECPFCSKPITFVNLHHFSRHRFSQHRDKSYKDFMDYMKIK